MLLIGLTATSCGDTNAALERLSEAQHLSADLYLQFTKVSAATDRAVMADTDEASIAFARESGDASRAIQRDIEALGPMLRTLGYTDETRQYETFISRFATYKELDRRILDLAVQNTNLKAQQLSFGPVQEAADAFRSALDAVTAARASDTWQAKALAETAIAAALQIQALQAPHIATADDGVMARLEERMKASEADARRALESLRPLVAPASKVHLDSASTALDRLMAVHAQLIGLSHQNTNVRSLALALDQKRALTTPCEESLRALRDALAKRGFPAGR